MKPEPIPEPKPKTPVEIVVDDEGLFTIVVMSVREAWKVRNNVCLDYQCRHCHVISGHSVEIDQQSVLGIAANIAGLVVTAARRGIDLTNKKDAAEVRRRGKEIRPGEALLYGVDGSPIA